MSGAGMHLLVVHFHYVFTECVLLADQINI